MLLRIISILLFLIQCAASLQAQQEWKAWTAVNVNLSFTKRIDLRLSHLRSYNLDGTGDNGFNQSSMVLGYDASKKVSLSAGFMHTGFPGSGNSTQRYFARFSYKIPVSILNWTNSIQGEWHSTSETRFRERIVFISRISNRKKIDFLNLTLSGTFWLYYNIGGNKLRYFDETGTVTGRFTPDGLHRYRLYLNASSKMTRNLSISLYYMRQQEFNMLTGEFRKINVINPATGKISRPFNNFNVAGISLSYDIPFYKSNKSKKN